MAHWKEGESGVCVSAYYGLYSCLCGGRRVSPPGHDAEKKTMEPADHSIGTFAAVPSLICNLSRQCFIVDTKHCALPRCQEVNGTRLQWIGLVVQLQGIVKGVMHLYLLRVAWSAGS